MRDWVEIGNRLKRFGARHKWSLPLFALSTVSFVKLARELREGELEGFDATARGIVVGRRGELDSVMFVLTEFGDWPSMTVLSLLVVGALLLTKRKREASFFVVAAAGAPLLNLGLKLLFHRARPDVALGYLIAAPASFSFPSGHAMGSMGVLASLVVLARVLGARRSYFWPLLVVAAVLLFGIAASRVYFGVHFPSDVVGGQLAGAAWVSAVTGWFYPRLLPGERRMLPGDQPPPDA